MRVEHLLVERGDAPPSVMADSLPPLDFLERVPLHVFPPASFDAYSRARHYTHFDVVKVLRRMGCKPLRALNIAGYVFDVLSGEGEPDEGGPACMAQLTRAQFLAVVRHGLSRHNYVKPKYIADFVNASVVHEKRTSYIILLGGTSGCGKSTLACLLASRLGITRVVSTDSIRHVMRRYRSREDAPELHASSYNSGAPQGGGESSEARQARVLGGYRRHAALVMDEVERVITRCTARRETVIIEGVHLRTDVMLDLHRRHPCVLPFLIHISNEAKHIERFAVRSKYMTLDTRYNRYARFFPNICTIQRFLVDEATRARIPLVDNTNVDRSIARILSSLIYCMDRVNAGQPLVSGGVFDMVPHGGARNERSKNPWSWSSRGMMRVLHMRRTAGGGAAPATASTTSASSASDETTSPQLVPTRPPPVASLARHAAHSVLRAGEEAAEGSDGECEGDGGDDDVDSLHEDDEDDDHATS